MQAKASGKRNSAMSGTERPTAQPQAGSQQADAQQEDLQASSEDLEERLKGIFNKFEIQVLGMMGLLIGYITVFYAKILGFTNIYIGVSGVALITLLLLSLDRSFTWRQSKRLVRALIVIIVCLLLTAPQLYFAWNVSVREAAAEALAQHNLQVSRQEVSVTPQVNVINEPSGGNL
jgi:Zn-dependent protease with chaperone function